MRLWGIIRLSWLLVAVGLWVAVLSGCGGSATSAAPVPLSGVYQGSLAAPRPGRALGDTITLQITKSPTGDSISGGATFTRPGGGMYTALIDEALSKLASSGAITVVLKDFNAEYLSMSINGTLSNGAIANGTWTAVLEAGGTENGSVTFSRLTEANVNLAGSWSGTFSPHAGGLSAFTANLTQDGSTLHGSMNLSGIDMTFNGSIQGRHWSGTWKEVGSTVTQVWVGSASPDGSSSNGTYTLGDGNKDGDFTCAKSSGSVRGLPSNVLVYFHFAQDASTGGLGTFFSYIVTPSGTGNSLFATLTDYPDGKYIVDVSRDLKHVLYKSTTSENATIWELNRVTNVLRPIATGLFGPARFDWSTEYAYLAEPTLVRRIRLSDLSQQTFPVSADQGAYVVDSTGRKLFFQRLLGDNMRQIESYDMVSGDTRVVCSLGTDTVDTLNVDPAGTTFAFDVYDPMVNDFSLKLVPVAGGVPTHVTYGYAPEFSPDGSELSFVANQSGASVIKVRNLGTSQERVIRTAPYGVYFVGLLYWTK